MARSQSTDIEAIAANQPVHFESGSAQKDAATGKNGDQGVQGDNDSITSQVKETHMIVATLIATVSFAAGFTMPGGYQSDKGPDQGYAILIKKIAFKAFVITNTIAMTLSSWSVMMQLYWLAYETKGKSMTKAFTYVYMCTMLALIAMVVAFITGTYVVLGHSSGLAIVACVLGLVLFFVLTECLTYDDDEEQRPHCLPLIIVFWLVCETIAKLRLICRLVREMLCKGFHKCKDPVCSTCTKKQSGQKKDPINVMS